MANPSPNGPLPVPESYRRLRIGPNPDRPGLSGRGTVRVPVPVAAFAANFSPIPRMAPPPLGRPVSGGRNGFTVSGGPTASVSGTGKSLRPRRAYGIYAEMRTGLL